MFNAFAVSSPGGDRRLLGFGSGGDRRSGPGGNRRPLLDKIDAKGGSAHAFPQPATYPLSFFATYLRQMVPARRSWANELWGQGPGPRRSGRNVGFMFLAFVVS